LQQNDFYRIMIHADLKNYFRPEGDKNLQAEMSIEEEMNR